MKVNVEVDATPEELRRFLGLPDVQSLQDELLEQVRERMRAGQRGYDPATLLGPLMAGQFQGMEALQRLLWDAFRQAGEKADGDETSGADGRR